MEHKKLHRLTIRISPEEKVRLEDLARQDHISLATVIRRILGNHLYPSLYLPDIMPQEKTTEKNPHRHRITLSLSDKEYSCIEESASMHGYAVNEYLKHVAMYGSIFLRPTISTFDLSSFMEGVSGAYAAYTAALVRLCEEKVLTEEQYANLSQLLEEILKTSSDLQKEIYRNRKIVRKAVIKETLAMIKKEYLYQKVSLMVKNKESI